MSCFFAPWTLRTDICNGRNGTGAMALRSLSIPRNRSAACPFRRAPGTGWITATRTDPGAPRSGRTSTGSPGHSPFVYSTGKIDARTGLIRSSKDVSTLETQFVYDSSGRLVEVQTPAVGVAPSSPPAWEVYSYTNASSGSGAVVTHRSFANGVQ